MSNFILLKPQLAQAPAQPNTGQPWMIASGGLLLLLAGLAAFSKVKADQLHKQKRFEEYKNRELQKKLKLALQTISKMEKKPGSDSFARV